MARRNAATWEKATLTERRYVQYAIRNTDLFDIVGEQEVKWAETERDTGTEVQFGGTKTGLGNQENDENIYPTFKRWL